MGRMARKARRKRRRIEILTVDDKMLYKEDGTPVLTTDEDAKYRKAYRALACVLDALPPDGIYSFDGRRMRVVQSE